jgi:hypothetical protein
MASVTVFGGDFNDLLWLSRPCLGHAILQGDVIRPRHPLSQTVGERMRCAKFAGDTTVLLKSAVDPLRVSACSSAQTPPGLPPSIEALHPIGLFGWSASNRGSISRREFQRCLMLKYAILTVAVLAGSAAQAGHGINGAQINALTHNHLTSNAITHNAVTQNALTFNSLMHNSLSLNALTANSVTHNALLANAITLNGLLNNGLMANGMIANGLNTNSLALNALNPNSLTHNGLANNGLSNNSVVALAPEAGGMQVVSIELPGGANVQR